MTGKRTLPLFLYLTLCALLPLQAQSPGETTQRGIRLREIQEVTDKAAVGKQWLVIIAINAYQEWLPLAGPVDDADDLREILIDRYRIDEILEIYDTEATKQDIIQLFQELARETKPQDSVLIFYAGHGHFDEESDAGYWIPVDGGKDDRERRNWLPNEQIRQYISDLPTRHVLLITDACFSGDILNIRRSRESEIQDGYFRRAYELISRQVLTSGALETVPDESKFAKNLKRELAKNDHPLIDPHMLFSGVRIGVGETLPLFGNLSDSGHEPGGSFLLFLDDDETSAGNRREKFWTERQHRKLMAKRLSTALPGLGELYRENYTAGALETSASIYLIAQYLTQRQQHTALQKKINGDFSPLLALNNPVAVAASLLQKQNRLERLNKLRNNANAAIQIYGLYWLFNFYRQNSLGIFSGYEGTDFTILSGGETLQMKLNVSY